MQPMNERNTSASKAYRTRKVDKRKMWRLPQNFKYSSSVDSFRPEHCRLDGILTLPYSLASHVLIQSLGHGILR